MNLTTVHQLLNTVSQLAEMSAYFSAKYGRNYRLKAGSPAEAWKLYHDAAHLQRILCGLLNADALDHASETQTWWHTHDMIDTNITAELFSEAHQLLVRVTYCAATSTDQNECFNAPGILAVQKQIAGMLHPSARQTPLRESYAA
jgi:hypothetical protein